MTIPKPQMVVERKLILLSIAELHFSLTITHLTVNVIWRRLLIMMFPMHQVLVMIEFTLAVGSSNWKNGRSVITVVRTSYSPTDDSYLSLKHLSVIFCHKNCTSPADFVLHQECLHLCLPLFVCPICHFTYIPHSCLCMHITESHGGLKAAISLIQNLEIVLSCYFVISKMWSPFDIVINFVIPANISSKCLIIVKDDNLQSSIYGF